MSKKKATHTRHLTARQRAARQSVSHRPASTIPLVFFHLRGEYDNLKATFEDFSPDYACAHEYLAGVSDLVEYALTTSNVVAVLPLHEDRYTELAGPDAPAFGTAQSQDLYLKLCDDSDRYLLHDISEFTMLLEADRVTSAVISAHRTRFNGEVDFLVAQDLADIAVGQFEAWLADVVADDPAHVTYVAATLDDDEPALSGVVDLPAGELSYWTTTADELLAAVCLLGVIASGALIVRRHVADTTLVYGFALRPEGLTGLTEAEIFNNSCIDADSGDLIPPSTASPTPRRCSLHRSFSLRSWPPQSPSALNSP